MKHGEETIMPNWALEAMEGLTFASDIKVLCFLVRHRAYRQNFFSPKQLGIALEIDVRTITSALAKLKQAGYIISADGKHTASIMSTKLPQGFYKSTRTSVENTLSETAKNDSLNKGTVGTVGTVELKEEEQTYVVLESEPPLEPVLVSVSAIATPDALVLEPSKPKTPKKSLTREMSLRFVAIWNDNCGNLPQADRLNSSRETGFNTLFREYELDEAGTGSALVAAVRCVAADPFWNERKYGLDNLLRKGAVTAKAEKWRSSQPKTARVIAQVSAETAQDAPRVTIGSRWLHPQSGQPLTVIEVHGNTVFFAPGGPVRDYWLSQMNDWKQLESEAPQAKPHFHGAGVAA